MSTRSRSRVGAKPRITRYARNNAGQFRVLNPLTELPVYAGIWADDPAWSNGGVGTAPESLRVTGSIGVTTATNAGASNRGTLTTSALLGGRRVIDMDGTDDYYALTTGVSLAQPFEVWAIATYDTLNMGSVDNMIIGTLSTASTRGIMQLAGGAFYMAQSGSGIIGGTAVVNTPYAIRGLFNNTSSSLVVNGTATAGSVGASTAMDQFIVGAGRFAPSTYGLFHDGKTALLLSLPAASITQAHRTAMGQWAAQFYGVPGFAGAFG